jgi:ATP-dependent DNA helicase RecG
MYYARGIENLGTGLRRISQACEAAGVKVEFRLTKPGFAAVFYRPANHTGGTGHQAGDTPYNPLSADQGGAGGAINNTLAGISGEDLNNALYDTFDDTANDPLDGAVLEEIVNGVRHKLQKQLLPLIAAHQSIALKELVERTGKSRSTIIRHIHILRDKNLVRRVGSKKTGYWEIVNDGKRPGPDSIAAGGSAAEPG